MGYSQADKQDTHDRIVRTAAARFRELGIDGISVADLMKDAGLTHGGFYKHFESRDHLVAEAVECALAEGDATLRGVLEKGKPTLARLVQAYLSEAHRDHPAEGCGVAALSADISRSTKKARAIYDRQIESNVAIVEKLLGDTPKNERRAKALGIIATLAGALAIARAAGDPALSREVLRSVGRELIEQHA